jgi:hypothetical protein
MPAKGDGISRRKDGRYVGRHTVHTPDGPKRKVTYGRKYKKAAITKALAVDTHELMKGVDNG